MNVYNVTNDKNLTNNSRKKRGDWAHLGAEYSIKLLSGMWGSVLAVFQYCERANLASLWLSSSSTHDLFFNPKNSWWLSTVEMDQNVSRRVNFLISSTFSSIVPDNIEILLSSVFQENNQD